MGVVVGLTVGFGELVTDGVGVGTLEVDGFGVLEPMGVELG